MERKVTKETLLAIVAQAAKTAGDKDPSGGAWKVYERMGIKGEIRAGFKRRRGEYVDLYSDLTTDPEKARSAITKREKRSDAMPEEARLLAYQHHMERCSRFESNKQGTRLKEEMVVKVRRETEEVVVVVVVHVVKVKRKGRALLSVSNLLVKIG